MCRYLGKRGRHRGTGQGEGCLYYLGLIRLRLYVVLCHSYEDWGDGWSDMFAGIFQVIFTVAAVVVGVIVAFTCIFG